MKSYTVKPNQYQKEYIMDNRKKYGNPPESLIVIAYRNDQGKMMHGAFYDHYTLRKITQRKTCVARGKEQSTTTFKNFIDQTTFALGVQENKGTRTIPSEYDSEKNAGGLLVITGRPRQDTDLARKKNEEELIRQAKLRGQPILGICAGSWRILESYKGKTVSVQDHCFSNMPRIVINGTVGNNVEIHKIKLTENTILSGTMSLGKMNHLNLYPSVNSVHWEAADKKNFPTQLEASAHSIQDKVAAPNNRQGQMKPEEDSIEAFESKDGAPVLGIQWHPEAYFNGKKDLESERHRNILKYMAKAGDAYQAKQKMLVEFKQLVTSKAGFFSQSTKTEKTLHKSAVFKNKNGC